MADEEQIRSGFAGRQYQPTNQDRDEEIVQVVYQSDQHGALVGVESTSLLASSSSAENFQPQPSTQQIGTNNNNNNNHEQHGSVAVEPLLNFGDSKECSAQVGTAGGPAPLTGSYHEQLSRAASTLPSVAEEPFTSGQMVGTTPEPMQADPNLADPLDQALFNPIDCKENNDPLAGFTNLGDDVSSGGGGFDASGQYTANTDGAVSLQQQQQQAPPIYSTIRRTQSARGQHPRQNQGAPRGGDQYSAEQYYPREHGHAFEQGGQQETRHESSKSLINYTTDESYHQASTLRPEVDYELSAEYEDNADPADETNRINQEITHILTRNKAGAVEKGSFKNNFRKKLGLSVSTNETDLTAYRQKLLETSQDTDEPSSAIERYSGQDSEDHLGSLSSKFKRTHSVSFNVHAARSNRHSVDIRNLPSYLTHKRASIVDVAKGAMSSLMSSLGSGGGSGSGSVVSGGLRRDSTKDDEPIFEEPIAPTLSLGQRVAMVRNIGAEFGTVGWIGQFPDVDDDWIVGVIFDNMIGDCDGSYNGVRYFYARENYAMFVPLSTLTKTDNYIGRPETGTMLSRMSVSLKPGQLISIQRSSIRLQHCFLNAPHQRVGHDVRAVSNRLHCQCHNCGPCAHLTKQGRINALPHFGAHHLPHKKKNSLAHAAVEMLAHHHHHHFHEEEEHDEKDYEFGDNAAHACNFVRYSCCQQTGTRGHEFSRDCEMVRPELLDNLIHAPKAPHRRHSRPRRTARGRRAVQGVQQCQILDKTHPAALENDTGNVASNVTTLEAQQSTLDRTTTLTTTSTIKSSEMVDGANSEQRAINCLAEKDEGVGGEQDDGRSDHSSYLSSQSGSGSGSGSSSRSGSPSQVPAVAQAPPYNYYQYDTSTFRPTNGVYSTINSQISFLDQQRFVYQRDSAALVRSPKASRYGSSDDYDGSNYSEPRGGVPSLGIKRILRCLGCMRPRARRRRHRRKLSFRDRVLEYRRRQSTFVPSTLAKPHEDFASHGIVLPQPGANRGSGSRHHRQSRGGEINSDYSSCSRSSCSSSRSNSPPNYPETACMNTTIPMQTQEYAQSQEQNRHTGTVSMEHQQASVNHQLKSVQQQQAGSFDQPKLDYGDFTFGDGYQSYEKQDVSRDSALTDLCFTDTYKSNSSSDTLKHLVDQSVNEQVSLPQPLPEHIDAMLSPLSSTSTRGVGEQESPQSGQYEISSPTVSVEDQPEALNDQETIRQELEGLSLETNEPSNHGDH